MLILHDSGELEKILFSSNQNQWSQNWNLGRLEVNHGFLDS